MALRDQPYFPLYVQDYLTDEKLNRCSASTQGIYIKMMCIFHKSEEYGGILLKQKDKQNSSNRLNFACLFAKLLPFSLLEIETAIDELIDEKVLHVDGDFIYQKRMTKDNKISLIRSISGSKGGKKTQNKIDIFAKAKFEAKLKQNTEYENENENEINTINDINKSNKFNFKSNLLALGVEPEIASDWMKVRAKKKASNTETAFKRIKSEIEKSGLTANECIKLSAEKDWSGFEAEWAVNYYNNKKPSQPKNRMVHYKLNGAFVTHAEHAYLSNQKQYPDIVEFIKYVE